MFLGVLQAVTALAFQAETLIVGFEDGQVKILRQGRDALIAKPFHSSNVQELKMLSDDLFVSSDQVELDEPAITSGQISSRPHVATSPLMMVSKGNHPQMALIQVSELF